MFPLMCGIQTRQQQELKKRGIRGRREQPWRAQWSESMMEAHCVCEWKYHDESSYFVKLTWAKKKKIKSSVKKKTKPNRTCRLSWLTLPVRMLIANRNNVTTGERMGIEGGHEPWSQRKSKEQWRPWGEGPGPAFSLPVPHSCAR